MKKILLDTSAYSNLVRGDKKVLSILEEAQIVFISPIILGELYAGFALGQKTQENREILEKFLAKSSVKILHTTSETAEFFAEIVVQLRASGTPIPTNDIWIAAQAMEKGAVVVSFDGHFEEVAGLRTVVLV